MQKFKFFSIFQQDLKEYQQDIYGAQSMELASLKRHLNWLSIKHEEAQSKMQRMDTEMGKLREEMANIREKQQKGRFLHLLVLKIH